MTVPHWHTAKEARRAGWFSRRHETDDAHRAAHARYSLKSKRHGRGQHRGTPYPAKGHTA